jgi:hypothetical protein
MSSGPWCGISGVVFWWKNAFDNMDRALTSTGYTGQSMHWFDVIAGMALLIGGIWSFCRGFTREILSILGIIAAIMLASRSYPAVAKHLDTFIAHPWLRQAAGFALIFLSTVIFYVVLAALLHRLVKAAGLSLPDRSSSSKLPSSLRPYAW